MSKIMDHEKLKKYSVLGLGMNHEHGFYEQLGFKSLRKPQNTMLFAGADADKIIQ